MSAFGLFLGLACLSAGQVLPPRVSTTARTQWRVPFEADTDKTERIRVYVSTDDGKSWVKVCEAASDIKAFDYSAPGVGTYLFAVQAVKKGGLVTPSGVDGLVPLFKVRVVQSGEVTKAAAEEVAKEISEIESRIAKLQSRLKELKRTSSPD